MKEAANNFWKKLKEASLVCALMTFEEREKQLQLYRDGFTRILLATEVLSRGIDVPETKIVVNVHLGHAANMNQACLKSYLYRVSRSGRMESDAMAITLINNETSKKLYQQVSNYFRFPLNQIHINI